MVLVHIVADCYLLPACWPPEYIPVPFSDISSHHFRHSAAHFMRSLGICILYALLFKMQCIYAKARLGVIEL